MLLQIIGKNIHLDIGEMEILKHLQEGAGLTEAEALKEVISYKREQALLYETKGNWELARHLLKAIDEWDGSRDKEFDDKIAALPQDVKIII